MGGTASYNENVKIYSSLEQIETHARKKIQLCEIINIMKKGIKINCQLSFSRGIK